MTCIIIDSMTHLKLIMSDFYCQLSLIHIFHILVRRRNRKYFGIRYMDTPLYIVQIIST